MSKQAFKRVRRRLGLTVSRDPLPAFDPGGYPLVYWCSDGGALCAGCANAEIDLVDAARPGRGSRRSTDPQWDVWGVDTVFEPGELICDHCGADINHSNPAEVS